MRVIDANWLVFPPLDPSVILQTVRILTGRRYRDFLDPDLASRLDATDLIIAARYIPSPERFVAELKRLGSRKSAKREARAIALGDLHGLGEAREWAEAAIADIAAWKRGEIAWSAVSSAIALEGPPGTGKTQFAKSFAAEVKFDLIVASYAKWQSSKEGHLGDTLRAMIDDFETARAQAPSVLFIDEIDSFPDRSRLTHAYRSYTIDVVNALLEQLDGLAGREGVIVISASNDLSRCDPALLRAGRFDKIARIRLPDLDELEAILRVRLGDDLQSTSIRSIAELSLGMTGADIEGVMNDARRTARRENRPLTIHDLRHALITNERPPELHWRICVHEAAHILVDVIHLGQEDVFASVFSIKDRGGVSRRTKLKREDGTYETYRKHLEIILAGRAGEEILMGSASDGAGSSTGSDLDRATRLAADMVGSVGLLGPNHLTYFGSRGSGAEFLRYGEVREAIARVLREADKSCRLLLEQNRAALRAVADHLLKNGRVDGKQVQVFLEHHSGWRQLKLHLTV